MSGQAANTGADLEHGDERRASRGPRACSRSRSRRAAGHARGVHAHGHGRSRAAASGRSRWSRCAERPDDLGSEREPELGAVRAARARRGARCRGRARGARGLPRPRATALALAVSESVPGRVGSAGPSRVSLWSCAIRAGAAVRARSCALACAAAARAPWRLAGLWHDYRALPEHRALGDRGQISAATAGSPAPPAAMPRRAGGRASALREVPRSAERRARPGAVPALRGRATRSSGRARDPAPGAGPLAVDLSAAEHRSPPAPRLLRSQLLRASRTLRELPPPRATIREPGLGGGLVALRRQRACRTSTVMHSRSVSSFELARPTRAPPRASPRRGGARRSGARRREPLAAAAVGASLPSSSARAASRSSFAQTAKVTRTASASPGSRGIARAIRARRGLVVADPARGDPVAQVGAVRPVAVARRRSACAASDVEGDERLARPR